MNSATILKIGMPPSSRKSPVPLNKTKCQPNGTASPCATCRGRCCYEYSVTVTGFDVWTIANGLRLAPEQFLIYFSIAADGSEGFKLDQSDRYFDLALDKMAVDRAHKPCIFLMELPGGGGRCGIYPLRPYVCQTFPAYLDRDVVALRDDVMCPTGAWKLPHMNLQAWRESMNDFVVQRDVYRHVVRCWNERVDDALAGQQFSVLEYYHFLLNVYPLLSETEKSCSSQNWQSIVAHWNRERDTRGNPLDWEPCAGKNTGPKLFAEVLTEIRSRIQQFRPSSKQP